MLLSVNLRIVGIEAATLIYPSSSPRSVYQQRLARRFERWRQGEVSSSCDLLMCSVGRRSICRLQKQRKCVSQRRTTTGRGAVVSVHCFLGTRRRFRSQVGIFPSGKCPLLVGIQVERMPLTLRSPSKMATPHESTHTHTHRHSAADL